MPLAQLILLKVPTITLGIIIVILTVLISIGGLLIVRHFVKHDKLKNHHDIAGPIFSTIGVIYAVMLAFVVVIAWQSFDIANSDVNKEANCLADLYRDASGFPEQFKSQVRTTVVVYVKSLVEEEWPLLASGGRSNHSHDLFTKIWDQYLSYEPKTESQKVFYSESIAKLNEAGELRSSRIAEARSGIHPVLWFVLLIGGFISIVFTFFFGSENRLAQIIMTALFSALIALLVFTIVVLDFPFTGDVSIPPDAFRIILMLSGN